MKWGKRKAERGGASRKTDRQARKDAKEFAGAKAYYGKGAGNRRKAIKNTVAGRAKKDSTYQQAFDRHLANQDMEKHTRKAKSKRTRTDVTESTAKTARGIGHIFNGNAQYASLAAAGVFAAGTWLYKSGLAKTAFNKGKQAASTAWNSDSARMGADYVRKLFKNG